MIFVLLYDQRAGFYFSVNFLTAWACVKDHFKIQSSGLADSFVSTYVRSAYLILWASKLFSEIPREVIVKVGFGVLFIWSTTYV